MRMEANKITRIIQLREAVLGLCFTRWFRIGVKLSFNRHSESYHVLTSERILGWGVRLICIVLHWYWFVVSISPKRETPSLPDLLEVFSTQPPGHPNQPCVWLILEETRMARTAKITQTRIEPVLVDFNKLFFYSVALELNRKHGTQTVARSPCTTLQYRLSCVDGKTDARKPFHRLCRQKV